MNPSSPSFYAVLSIAAAVTTIALKFSAYLFTGSVGLLSDAIESLINLFTAVTALIVLSIAARPADANHMYGHSKAEYFSSVSEGIFILIAAGGIGFTAVHRILNPSALHEPFIGIGVSAVASVINFVVALTLLRAGKKFRSITLESDGHHLMTDVWTSVAVILGITAVYLTGIQILDPAIAIFVSANIVFSGYRIIRESVLGFMDTAIPAEESDKLKKLIAAHAGNGVSFHGLRTRQSASRRFVSFHVLVPGAWTVRRGHNLLEEIESDIHTHFEKMTVTTHLEPKEDPRSNKDIAIDRT